MKVAFTFALRSLAVIALLAGGACTQDMDPSPNNDGGAALTDGGGGGGGADAAASLDANQVVMDAAPLLDANPCNYDAGMYDAAPFDGGPGDAGPCDFDAGMPSDAGAPDALSM
jgi:hypothetical protein